MKKGFVLLGMLVAILVGAGTPSPDYSNRQNWALRPEKNEQKIDLFYIYPTLAADREKPLMDWSDPKLHRKTVDFATAQTAGFADFCNIYAPFVRQLEFFRCIDALKTGAHMRPGTQIDVGVADTVAAFLHYLKHDNNGRKFILLGHSQGSTDLYRMLEEHPEIIRDKRFVAAYLPGIAIPLDSKFPLARNASDTGVVISWNTEGRNADKSFFSGPGTYCINPLSWRTDATPAAETENINAMLYNYRTGKVENKPGFCNAAIDPERGALIVDLPPGNWDSIGGRGVYHVYDIYFFYGNLIANARLRAGI